MFPLKEMQLCVDDIESVKRNSDKVFEFSKEWVNASCELGAKASWGWESLLNGYKHYWGHWLPVGRETSEWRLKGSDIDWEKLILHERWYSGRRIWKQYSIWSCRSVWKGKNESFFGPCIEERKQLWSQCIIDLNKRDMQSSQHFG